jgi:hypothetical protein
MARRHPHDRDEGQQEQVIGYYDRDGVEIDLQTWSRLLNSIYQRVALASIVDLSAPEVAYDVSTVWLGMDHGFSDVGPPIIFETMIFGDGDLDSTCRRYATEEEALHGHQEMIDIVRAIMTDPLVTDTTAGRGADANADG